jgi:antitoxin ParD1/3/4
MNVSLTPHLEQFIAKHVKSGRYQSASEVVREALRLLQDRDWRLAELRKEVQKGIDQLERGEGMVMDARLVEEIKARGRKRLAQLRRKAG